MLKTCLTIMVNKAVVESLKILIIIQLNYYLNFILQFRIAE